MFPMEDLDHQIDALKATLASSLGGIKTLETEAQTKIDSEMNEMQGVLNRAEYIIEDTVKQTLTYINHLGELPAAKARVDLTPQVQWLRQSIEDIMNAIISAHLRVRSALDTATGSGQAIRDTAQQISQCSALISSCHQEVVRLEWEARCSSDYICCVEGGVDGHLPDGLSSLEDEILATEQQAEDEGRRRDVSQQKASQARHEISVAKGRLEDFRRDKGVAESWGILGAVAAPCTFGGSLLVSGLAVGVLVWSSRVKSKLKRDLSVLLSRESAFLQESSRYARRASRLEKKSWNLRVSAEQYRDEISRRQTMHAHTERLLQTTKKLVEDALKSLDRLGPTLSKQSELETGLRAAGRQMEKIRTYIRKEAFAMQAPYDNTLGRTAGRSGEFSRRKKAMDDVVVALQLAQRDIPALTASMCAIGLFKRGIAGGAAAMRASSTRKAIPRVLLYDL